MDRALVLNNSKFGKVSSPPTNIVITLGWLFNLKNNFGSIVFFFFLENLKNQITSNFGLLKNKFKTQRTYDFDFWKKKFKIKDPPVLVILDKLRRTSGF